jgi:hypothetical protein
VCPLAGKILELRNILRPEVLASDIVSMYSQWKIQRDVKEEEWKELRNFLFATDTSTTSNRTLPWKNSTTTPKLAQLRDNLHANYMAALFSNPDWMKWEGDNLNDDVRTKREGIESYMKNKTKNSGFELTIAKLLYDYIDYGNVFGEVIFVNEEITDSETGEIIKGYVGPKLIRTSPFDIVFNPTAPSFISSPKITRYVKSIGELEQDLKEREDLNYDPVAVAKIKEVRTLLGGYKDSDLDKAEGYLLDGFGSMHEYYTSGYVEILEFEGDIYDQESGSFYKNYTITVLDRKYIARKEKNPSWLGHGARAHVGWRERPDNLYAMGPLENLVGMQYRIDHLENLKADALDLTIHPPKVITGDVEAFEWGPDAEIHISDGDGSIQLLSPNVAAFQVNNEIAYLMGLMDEMAGAPREAMGIRTPGEKTAFEVQQLQNAAGRLFQDKISKFEKEFIEPILNIMLEVGRRNLVGADVVRILNDDLGMVDFLSVTKEDIKASGKLRPLGSSHFAAQAQLVQNMAGVFGSPVGQMIAPHVSTKNLAKAIEELFGWEKYAVVRENVAIFEQAETQQLMNSLQEQMQVEQATPVQPGLPPEQPPQEVIQ